jgi:hypothetical protein
LRSVLKARHYEFDVERAIYLTVLHRLFASGSDRAAERWREDYLIPGTEGLELHHLYRAMAFLGDPIEQLDKPAGAVRCNKDLIEEALFESGVTNAPIFTACARVRCRPVSRFVPHPKSAAVGFHSSRRQASYPLNTSIIREVFGRRKVFGLRIRRIACGCRAGFWGAHRCSGQTGPGQSGKTENLPASETAVTMIWISMFHVCVLMFVSC